MDSRRVLRKMLLAMMQSSVIKTGVKTMLRLIPIVIFLQIIKKIINLTLIRDAFC